MNVTGIKTRDDLTFQDLKNIRQLLLKGQGYQTDTMWRMLKGARTMAPLVDEAIDIYMSKQIEASMELERISDELLAKHGFTPEMVESC